jgi:hypothetical protein
MRWDLTLLQVLTGSFNMLLQLAVAALAIKAHASPTWNQPSRTNKQLQARDARPTDYAAHIIDQPVGSFYQRQMHGD